jgi:septal ring factor EnvC (AmiA/AmiB activator)
MTDKEQDAPVPRKKEKTALQTGITLRLGPDSKLSLPIQGSNLIMMLVIAGQLFFRFADMPDDVDAIKKDLSTIQGDIKDLKMQGTERDKSIGSLETRVEILEVSRDNLSGELKSMEDQNSELETEIDRLERCIQRGSKCRE